MKQKHTIIKNIALAIGVVGIATSSSFGSDKDILVNSPQTLQMTSLSTILRYAYEEKQNFHLELPMNDFDEFSHNYKHIPNPVQDAFYPYAIEEPEHLHSVTLKNWKGNVTLDMQIGKDSKNILTTCTLPVGEERKALIHLVTSLFVQIFPETRTFGWVQSGMIYNYEAFKKVYFL